MTTTAPPPAPPRKPAPPPPPRSNAPAPQANPTGNESFEIDDGVTYGPQRIILFGTGGIGKTSLFSKDILEQVGKNGLMLDCEGGSRAIPMRRIKSNELTTYGRVRAALNVSNPIWNGVDIVGLDSLTKVQELAKQHVIENVPHEKQKKITCIEDYGFGKGNGHILNHMMLILGDLDQHIRAGRSVFIVCHDVAGKKPNPEGEDFLQYQPRLLQTPEYTFRNAAKEWTDHLVFLGYDVFVEDGKAKGGESRTFYFTETPSHLAKSRYVRDPLVYQEGSAEFWKQIFAKE